MHLSRLLKYLLLLLYLLTTVPRAFAQNASIQEDTIVAPDLYERFPRYRLSSIGFSVNTLRDEALSPLRYEEAGVVGTIQYWKYKGDKRLVQNTVSFGASNYTNAVNDDAIGAFAFY